MRLSVNNNTVWLLMQDESRYGIIFKVRLSLMNFRQFPFLEQASSIWICLQSGIYHQILKCGRNRWRQCLQTIFHRAVICRNYFYPFIFIFMGCASWCGLHFIASNETYHYHRWWFWRYWNRKTLKKSGYSDCNFISVIIIILKY